MCFAVLRKKGAEMTEKIPLELKKKIHEFLMDDFSPAFGVVQPEAPGNKLWEKLRTLGTELWLDTGNMDEISEHYTPQFSAVTTNNTLLNKEVQTGRYDSLISEIARYHRRIQTRREAAYAGIRLCP